MEGSTQICTHRFTGTSAELFLTLINSLFATNCLISDLDNYPKNFGLKLQDADEFDFIVVGAGSAGSVVANKLSENPNWTVLVLEAGDYPSSDTDVPGLFYSAQGTTTDWQYLTEPTRNACVGIKEGRCRWPRGKCLGGTSSINAMLYLRGNRRSFGQWAADGNPGWSYQTILKHYKAIEDVQEDDLTKYFGAGGPLSLIRDKPGHEVLTNAIKNAAEVLGYPSKNHEDNLGYFTTVQNIKDGVRVNAAKAFLSSVKNRTNLFMAVNAVVEKVLISSDLIAEAVQLKINGKVLVLKARKEIVLSGGAINSPQILMVSGIGPKEHLSEMNIQVVKDLPVGENLQDHNMFFGFKVSMSDKAVDSINTLDNLYAYFKNRKGFLSGTGTINTVGFINTRNNSKYPNIQIHHFLYLQNDQYVLTEAARALGLTDNIFNTMKEANKKSPTMIMASTLLNPGSRGRILLASSDPQDKPLIYANYYDDVSDIQVMLESIRYLETLIETKPLQELGVKLVDLKIKECTNYSYRSDDYWQCMLKYLSLTSYHPAGTCKMGPGSDPSSVVDSRLRVHGIKNLRVIDASIMPVIVAADINGPSMVIGHKGGSMILEDWQ